MGGIRVALGAVMVIGAIGSCAKKSPVGATASQETAARERVNSSGVEARGIEDQIAEERRRNIEAEIERLQDHPWAGKYYMGDGLGMNVNLWIAPDAGFLFEWHGCLGLYARNYGKVVGEGEQIRLECERPKEWKFEHVGSDLLVVKWGQRHYLVSSAKMAEFCAAVDSTGRWGREPRLDIHGNYLLRWGDEQKSAAGSPDVPEEYRERLVRRAQ